MKFMRWFSHYETRREPVASPKRFARRLLRNGLWALAVVTAAQAIGMAGYMGFEGMSFEDAFVNAAMILSGMGPMKTDLNSATKYFSGFYAIACGLLLFAVAGLLLAPVFHRLLHHFHMEGGGNLKEETKDR
jgi:sterol desaturase/sphingolipid hydroxylase (fatty acid hydroxylase superfamily)